MSNSTLQLIVALVVVAGAVFVVGRWVYRFVKGEPKGGCGTGSCGSCAADSSTTGVTQKPLVQLGLPTERPVAENGRTKK